NAWLRAETVHITGTGPIDIVVGSVDGLLTTAPERAGDLKSESANLTLSLRAIGEHALSVVKEPIDKADLSLALTGPLPWGGTPDALTRWRDAGGTLELRQIAVAWSGLTLDGDGTAALDDQMRPEGVLTLRLDGLQPTLQRLTEEGALPPALAEAIGQH